MSLVNGQVARTSDGDTALETPHSVNTSSISAHVTPEQGLFEGSQPDLDFGDEKSCGSFQLEHGSAYMDGCGASHFLRMMLQGAQRSQCRVLITIGLFLKPA